MTDEIIDNNENKSNDLSSTDLSSTEFESIYRYYSNDNNIIEVIPPKPERCCNLFDLFCCFMNNDYAFL
jgi:hypothetical protein